MQTRIELLQAENAQLNQEKMQMELDMQEIEQNLDRVATELKEQDYDFMEVLDENEEFEVQYDEMAREYERAQLVIEEQLKSIEGKDRELGDAIARIKQLEEDVEAKVKELDRMQGKFKRNRVEFEGASEGESSGQGDKKRFKINPSVCEAGVGGCPSDTAGGFSSHSSCNSGKYHRFCKHPEQEQ